MTNKFIPERLKKCRESLGLSQEGLLSALGKIDFTVSRGTISSWENGDTRPDVEQLAKLCEVFEKPVSYFFDLEHSKTG